MHKAIEEFLDRATEGLRDDEELRLDARAELATHAEEKVRELMAEGKPEEEAVQETLKAMGETLDLSGELHEANRSRMNFRAKVRLFLRFALVPAAILAAAWAADWPAPLRSLRATSTALTDSWYVDQGPVPRRDLDDRERLILYGDTTRAKEAEVQKAIWEAYPTNRVYFGNYLAHALAEAGHATNLPPDLVETARALDPDNALYVHLEARKILGATRPRVHVDWGMVPDGLTQEPVAQHEDRDVDGAILLFDTEEEEGAPPPPSRYEVLDRDRLDRAMETMEGALAMPYARRRQMEMLEERLAIMGPPQRMFEVIQRVAESVSVLLPHIGGDRELARVATAYGDLLLREGDTERAAVFLGAWEPLSRQMLEGADTLIEVLVANAVIREGGTAAAAYREAGMEREAERMLARKEAASAPVARWKERREAGDGALGETIERYGGVLASVLMPALGESLPAGAFDPSRRLEYTLATESLVGAVILALFLAMAGCLLVALRWRFSKAGRAIPLLLVPRWRELAAILGLGVLLPGAVFLLATRGLPFSGHAYAMKAGTHKLIAEFGLLVLALAALPAALAARAVRTRCRELQIPTRPPSSRFGRWAMAIGAVVLVIAWCIPVGRGPSWPVWLAGFGAVFGALGAVSVALVSFGRGMGNDERFGLYHGSLHRSLIPLLAMAVVVLSLLSRPILYGSEARYISRDTMFATSERGFTSLEVQVTDRLRSEMLAVLEGLRASR